MPTTSTSGFDISSDTCCSPISASPLETSTLTRPLGPPAASLTFGVISAAMPSRWNTRSICAAVMLPPAGAAWPTVLAASSARLSASGDDTSGLGAPLRTAMPMPVRARSVRPATTLPRLMSSSIAVLSVRNTSTGSPRSKRGISALEGRQQFVRRRLDRGRDEGVDLGGVGGRARSEHGDDDCNCAHDIPRHGADAFTSVGREVLGLAYNPRPLAGSPHSAYGRSATSHLACRAQTR